MKKMLTGMMEAMGMTQDQIEKNFECFKQFKKQWKCDHGLQGCGPRGWGGQGEKKKMMAQFMEQMGCTQDQINKGMGDFEQIKKDWWANNGGCNAWGPKGHGCHGGEKPWKIKRAKVLQFPSEELECFPGQLLMVPVEVRNDTQWPWKENVFLGMSDSVELTELPCDPVFLQIDKQLKPMETLKLQVPIQVYDRAIADGKVHELTLNFRGPKGGTFGEPIPLKLKVMPGQGIVIGEPIDMKTQELNEIEQYKMAIKLLDNLKLGKDLASVM